MQFLYCFLPFYVYLFLFILLLYLFIFCLLIFCIGLSFSSFLDFYLGALTHSYTLQSARSLSLAFSPLHSPTPFSTPARIRRNSPPRKAKSNSYNYNPRTHRILFVPAQWKSPKRIFQTTTIYTRVPPPPLPTPLRTYPLYGNRKSIEQQLQINVEPQPAPNCVVWKHSGVCNEGGSWRGSLPQNEATQQ